MKKISSEKLIEEISNLIIDVNYKFSEHIKKKIFYVYKNEKEKYSKKYLKIILENLLISEKEKIPICQDTGLPIIFLEIGNKVQIELGKYKNFEDVINKGIEIGSKKGFLRKSIVTPLDRKNTGTNTPAILHLIPSEGEKFKITVMAKGFGSENVCSLKMLNPSEGKKGIENFIIETVEKAGTKPCPPIFIGVGIGGSFEKCAILSKIALCEIGVEKSPPDIMKWEKKILNKINNLKIGPGGFGGKFTALDIKIKTFPTHIAGLPVAVSISCWAHRVRSVEL